MLRLILKLIAGVAALSILVVGVLAVALPRLVNTEEFRTALHEGAAEALGTPVEWSRLTAGIVPLRLIIEEPVLLAEATNREDARLTAASIDLRISAMALLERRVQVDSLVLRGVELVVTRTEQGFILPLASGEEGEEETAAESAEPDESSSDVDAEVSGEEGLALAVRRLVVTDSRLIVRDRILPRPIDWQLRELEFEATGDALDEPLDVDLKAKLEANEEAVGGVAASGTMTMSGGYDLDLILDQMVLAELQPYLSDATLAGKMSGRISVEGEGDLVSALETDLQVEEMAVRSFGLDLAGRLDLEASQTLDQPWVFAAAIDLGNGGKANVAGEMNLLGAIDARIDMQGLELASFSKLAGSEIEIAGRATGPVELATNDEGDVKRLSTDLKIANARYSDAALALGGALDLAIGLDGLGENDPFRFDVALDLDGGGHVDGAGSATLGGAIDAKLNVAAVDLMRVAAWVPEGSEVRGELTGNADIKLTSERRIERLATRFKVASARIVSEGVDVAGVFDLDARLTKQGPIQLDANLVLDDKSALSVTGTSTVEGVADVHLEIETFNLAVAKPFLPDPEMQIAGRASGTGRLVGDVTAPEFLSFDVGIEGGSFKTSEYSVEGPFLATMKVKEPLSRPRGRIDLDLTAASLTYLDQFSKAAGMRAEMITRFVPEESGEIVFESQLKLRDIDEILLQGAIGETTSVSMSTSRFNLKGWSEVFPSLETYQANGVVELDGLAVELVDGAPRQFGGRIGLRGVGLTIPDVGEVRLRGSILGEEKTIRLKGMKALLGGATFGIKGVVKDPLGKGEFDFSIQTLKEAEVNDLLSELTSTRDIVYGAFDLDGELQGELGGSGDLLQTLTGDLRFTIGEKRGGRLRGVSILRSVLDQIPLLGGAARLSAPFRGGRSVDDYYTERFEVIEGDFIVAGGKIDARTLRLAYPGYEARLQGPMRLRDLQIDMTGELLLKGDLVSTIGGLAGADIDREPIRIQLAKVGNTLDDPKISMTRETLAAVPKLLFQATGIDSLTLGVGKTVGKAIGRAVGGGK